MEKMIYFDNAATTYPKPECVYERMNQVNRDYAVNAGRGSYAVARTASSMIEDTRTELLELVNGSEVAEVVLSPSATIALNQIIGGFTFDENACVYVSPYEHNAVARTLSLHLSSDQIVEMPLKKDTLEIDMEMLDYMFAKKRPTHVVTSFVSNVTGYVLPVQKITKTAKEYGAVTAVDASQALGLVPIDLADLQADFLVFAGHKTLYGPFGIAGFYKRKDASLNVYLAGGTGSDSLNTDMPEKGTTRYEPASANIVAIAGLQEALHFLKEKAGTYQESVNQIYEQEKKLTDLLLKGLQDIDGVHTYMNDLQNHVGIVAFNIEGIQSSEVGMILDQDFHIAVRTGYHCAPYIHAHLQDEGYLGVVRASIGQFTTKDEIEKFVEAVGEIVEG